MVLEKLFVNLNNIEIVAQNLLTNCKHQELTYTVPVPEIDNFWLVNYFATF